MSHKDWEQPLLPPLTRGQAAVVCVGIAIVCILLYLFGI
jgi:hypothetical protein